tara:strand:+ start:438 stop:1256 length:819 start_codon:yes stop_codon:yes gene_type:complete
MKVCICSTAGCANLLNYYVNNKSFYFILRKEAKKIFRYRLKKIKTISYKKSINKCQKFYVGTGSDYDKNCIKNLKKKNKYVVAVFDHWINFEKRIYREYLPDEAWVFDEISKKILRKIYPSIKIILKKNLYFLDQKKIFSKTKKVKKDILYISEPLEKKQDIKSLNYFINILKKSNITFRYLLIKVHPKEKIKKYKKFLKKNKIKIKIFKNSKLISLFGSSKFVVGRNSMGLALSSYLKLKTFYCIPKSAGKFKLPDTKIRNFGKNIKKIEN